MPAVTHRLRAAADARGLSATEIGRMTGLPQSTVYRVLSGEFGDPSARVVMLIAQAVGLRMPGWQREDYPLPKENR